MAVGCGMGFWGVEWWCGGVCGVRCVVGVGLISADQWVYLPLTKFFPKKGVKLTERSKIEERPYNLLFSYG